MPPLGEGGAVALVRLAVLFATVKLILVVWVWRCPAAARESGAGTCPRHAPQVTVLLRDQLRGIWRADVDR